MTYFNIDGFEIDIILPTSTMECDIRILNLKAKLSALLHGRNNELAAKETHVELAILEAWLASGSAQLATLISKSRFSHAQLETPDSIIQSLHSVLLRLYEQGQPFGNDELAAMSAARAYIREKTALSVLPEEMLVLANNFYKNGTNKSCVESLLIEPESSNGNGQPKNETLARSNEVEGLKKSINKLQNLLEGLSEKVERERRLRIKKEENSSENLKMIFRCLHGLILNVQNPDSNSAKSELILMMRQLDFVSKGVLKNKDWGVRENLASDHLDDEEVDLT